MFLLTFEHVNVVNLQLIELNQYELIFTAHALRIRAHPAQPFLSVNLYRHSAQFEDEGVVPVLVVALRVGQC